MITADAHPILKMENKQTLSSSGTQEDPIMKPVDQRARSRGRNDIMTRRLKNRERQRRYRARKRLEAESKKSSVLRETPSIEAEPTFERQIQPNVNHHNFVARIYCKRDWKKDARQANACKHQEVTTPNGSVDPFPTLTGEHEAALLASVSKAEQTWERKNQYEFPPGIVNSETPRIVQSGRDWKAEARRKKS